MGLKAAAMLRDLSTALGVLPELAEATVMETRVGFRPTTGSNCWAPSNGSLV